MTELRLSEITDCEGANAFLPWFFARYNARLAQSAAQPDPAYRPWPAGLDFQTAFCFKHIRRSTTTTLSRLALGACRSCPVPTTAARPRHAWKSMNGSSVPFVWSRGRQLATHLLTPSQAGRIHARTHRRVRPTTQVFPPRPPRGGYPDIVPAAQNASSGFWEDISRPARGSRPFNDARGDRQLFIPGGRPRTRRNDETNCARREEHFHGIVKRTELLVKHSGYRIGAWARMPKASVVVGLQANLASTDRPAAGLRKQRFWGLYSTRCNAIRWSKVA